MSAAANTKMLETHKQGDCPDEGCSAVGHMTTFLAGDVGGKRLDDAVADYPRGQEATDQPEVPAKRRAQVHRQSHHEPDIPCTEQKQPCGREDVDGPALGQHVAELRLGLGLAQVFFQEDQTSDPDQGQHRRHGQYRLAETEQRKQCSPEEETHAFERVFRACQDGHPFVEGALLAVRYQELDGALGAHLVQVLGNAGQRLGGHHPRYRQRGCWYREHQQGNDLHAKADIHGAVESQAGAEVTAHQVGDHAEHFVEQEQRRDLKRRVCRYDPMKCPQLEKRRFPKARPGTVREILDPGWPGACRPRRSGGRGCHAMPRVLVGNAAHSLDARRQSTRG